MQPGTDESCCDNKDCGPADYKFDGDGNLFMRRFQETKWWPIPKEKIMYRNTPDGDAHLCGVEVDEKYSEMNVVYCAVLPIPTN